MYDRVASFLMADESFQVKFLETKKAELMISRSSSKLSDFFAGPTLFEAARYFCFSFLFQSSVIVFPNPFSDLL